MTRAVPEWIGATADTPIPDRVKLRNFEAHGGKCHRSGIKIRAGDKWETDHIIALVNWNPTPDKPHGNRESNLAPILAGKVHKAKTAEDVAEKALIYRKRAKNLLTKEPHPNFRKPEGYKHQWGRR